MSWKISYYSEAVQRETLAMPAGFLARYLRYAKQMEQLGRNIVILHLFVKKTEKTPRRELGIAERRLKEMKDAYARRA